MVNLVHVAVVVARVAGVVSARSISFLAMKGPS
jgi:hypothetical protein